MIFFIYLFFLISVNIFAEDKHHDHHDHDHHHEKKEKKSLSSHEHGVSKLNIVQDNNNISFSAVLALLILFCLPILAKRIKK